MCFMSDGTFKLKNKTSLGLNHDAKIYVINYVKSFSGKRVAEGLTQFNTVHRDTQIDLCDAK